MKTKLKLYVWTNFQPNWSGGLAFAIAASETEARRLIIKEHGYEPGNWGNLEVRRVDRQFAASVAGGG